MPLYLAQHITAQAHALGKPVFAHLSNNQGIEVAAQSGVDILAHTTPTDGPRTADFAKRQVAAHLTLTPTLTLWESESRKSNISAADLKEGMPGSCSHERHFESPHAGTDWLVPASQRKLQLQSLRG